MTTICFIGGGNMATALIGGLLQKGAAPASLRVVEVSAAQREALAARFGVATFAALDPAALQADVVVLAVKPQQLLEVARALVPQLGAQLVVSIAAGVRAGDLSRWLGGWRRVVRAMPNTPALVQQGMTGLYALDGVDEAGRAQAAAILGAVGAVLWFDDEAQLDAVTAVSGSGPAYVFYFIEALEAAARELGLAQAQARALALATFAGAARLAAGSDEDTATLRARVTSKGGTTERAIQCLEQDEVRRHIIRAVRAAAERSRELGAMLGGADRA